MKYLNTLVVIAFVAFAVLVVWSIVRNREPQTSSDIPLVEEPLFYPDYGEKG